MVIFGPFSGAKSEPSRSGPFGREGCYFKGPAVGKNDPKNDAPPTPDWHQVLAIKCPKMGIYGQNLMPVGGRRGVERRQTVYSNDF